MLEVWNDFLLADMNQGREFTRSQRSLLQVFQDLLAQCLLSLTGFLGTLVGHVPSIAGSIARPHRGGLSSYGVICSQVLTTISGT